MANPKCKKDVREDSSGVDFAFSTGDVLQVNITELPESIVTKLILHGISQKVGDSYAGAETAEDAQKAATEMIDRLYEGDWKTVRSTGASKTKTVLVDALMRALEKSFEDVTELLEYKSTDERTALGKHPQIAPFVEQIKLERAQAKLDKAKEAATQPVDENAPSLGDLLQ